jgi:small subunit ribosomal protein S5
VKGGRRFSFAAMVVVGNHNGEIGWGYGKAAEVPDAINKATKAANRSRVRVTMKANTIPHQVLGRFGASKVILIPASPGTGIKAGASVRAVVEQAGIKDILTKARGSTCAMNLVKATFDALSKLKTREEISRLRGVNV